MTLSPTYLLTTDHAASQGGVPVLVHRTTGAAYAPTDLIEVRSSQRPSTAASFVTRMTQAMVLGPVDTEMVARFCGMDAQTQPQ
jgi:hypothetical protein